MVTVETLAKLWDSGAGANVELLESVLEEVKDGYEFGVILMEPDLYRDYVQILGDFRSSKAVVLESVRIPEKPHYSSPQEFLKGSEGEVEVLAHLNVQGAEIKGVYRFGRLMGVSAGVRTISGMVRNVFPEEVDDFQDADCVEVIGTIGDFSDSNKVLRNTVNKLRRGVTKGLEVYVHGVKGLGIETLQDELKFLYEKGFKIPHLVTTKAEAENIPVDRVQNFFEGLAAKGLGYWAEGFKLRVNSNSLYRSLGSKKMLIQRGPYWEDSVRESTIERVEFKDNGMYKIPEARIKPVEVFKGKVIEAVGLKNIRIMERYGYTRGAKVYFKYNARMGVQLCDQQGRLLA